MGYLQSVLIGFELDTFEAEKIQWLQLATGLTFEPFNELAERFNQLANSKARVNSQLRDSLRKRTKHTPMDHAPAAVRQRFDSMFDRVTDELEQGIISAEEHLHHLWRVLRLEQRLFTNAFAEMHATGSPEPVRRAQRIISLLMQITLKTFKQREEKYITDTGKCFHMVEGCGNSRSARLVDHAPLGLNPCKSCIQA